jgi:hypothetical protein
MRNHYIKLVIQSKIKINHKKNVMKANKTN